MVNGNLQGEKKKKRATNSTGCMWGRGGVHSRISLETEAFRVDLNENMVVPNNNSSALAAWLPSPGRLYEQHEYIIGWIPLFIPFLNFESKNYKNR